VEPIAAASSQQPINRAETQTTPKMPGSNQKFDLWSLLLVKSSNASFSLSLKLKFILVTDPELTETMTSCQRITNFNSPK
jgi:hypothetical protein